MTKKELEKVLRSFEVGFKINENYIFGELNEKSINELLSIISNAFSLKKIDRIISYYLVDVKEEFVSFYNKNLEKVQYDDIIDFQKNVTNVCCKIKIEIIIERLVDSIYNYFDFFTIENFVVVDFNK